MSTKIPKACEPCRLRKKRCSGSHPCQRPECQDSPQDCVYRLKTRTRKSLKRPGASISNTSAKESSLTTWSDHQDGDKDTEQGAQHEVYHSVTETHLSPKSTDSSQLFYGPSSNFAFLQQLHRSGLSISRVGQPARGESRSGLDTFLQRSIFFGTPPRISPESIRSSNIQLATVSYGQAKDFLEAFKVISHFRLPFYTTEELDGLLESLYNSRTAQTIPPQTKAVFLITLAIGALLTPHTELAETLMTQAKREGVIFDDAVTLQMVQLAILFADYQVNMGRPNSAYLHLGVACRKAFALGLIKAPSTGSRTIAPQKHQATLWSLYFYETCQALTLGRRSSLKLADIECPFPTEPVAIVRLCSIARIMEDTSNALYGRKADSIRQLYVTAADLHNRLIQFAEENGLASARAGRSQDALEIHESLTLHNLYYHAILLIFRPFLVAKHAMRVKGGKDVREMWLRQACRYAVDAAQDSIEFVGSMLISGQICTGFRYQAFFLECSCAVLLYDILCQPSKYSYNMEYIKKAMQALSCMVADEPVTTALNSVSRVLETIEASISSQMSSPHPVMPNSIATGSHHDINIQFPPLNPLGRDGSENVTLVTTETDTELERTDTSLAEFAGTGIHEDWSDPNYFNLNVMTTDLFNFLPMDMLNPLEYPTDGSSNIP